MNITLKKFLIFLTVVVVSLTSVALTSCESSDDLVSASTQDFYDGELNRLYCSIDSLHNEYSTSDVARGGFINKWGRRFLVSAFDACVAALTAETGPGAFICSTLASGAYDDYLDYVDRKYRVSPKRNSRITSNSFQSVIFPSSAPSFVDSIGYYHNLVINEIQVSGQSFIDKDGEIDYNSYYDFIAKIAKAKGIASSNSINKSLVFKYIASIIHPFAKLEEGNVDTIISIVFNDTYEDFKFGKAKTLMLQNVCEKIIYNDLSVNADQVVEYAAKVNDLITTSNVAIDTKVTMQVANNIAVNSSLYWSVKYDEIQE